MISLLLSGLLLSPTQHPIQEPQMMPEPKIERVTFKVVPSEYEIKVKEEEKKRKAAQQRYERSWKSGSLTAYCNCKDTLNGETGITASGYPLDNGITYKGYRILAADRSIKLGTLIDIKIDNQILHGIVLDRGGAIQGSHFDMVFSSRASAMRFGVRDVKWQKVGWMDVK